MHRVRFLVQSLRMEVPANVTLYTDYTYGVWRMCSTFSTRCNAEHATTPSPRIPGPPRLAMQPNIYEFCCAYCGR